MNFPVMTGGSMEDDKVTIVTAAGVPLKIDSSQLREILNKSKEDNDEPDDTDDPCKTLTIHESDTNKIDVSVYVKLTQVDKYIDKIGFEYKFYCTTCSYKCETFQNLANHIESNLCDQILSTNEAKRQGEHNYARFHPNSDDDDDDDDDCDDDYYFEPAEKKVKSVGRFKTKTPHPPRIRTSIKTQTLCQETLQKGLTVPKPTENGTYQCFVCSYSNLLSETEFEQHMQCHFLDENEKLLQCYLCAQEGSNTFNNDIHEWIYLREHLGQHHGIDFRIPCSYCDTVLPNHTAQREHERSQHILSCRHCLFTCLKASHMEIHWNCHDADNSKGFFCFICGFRSARFPDRWSSVQSHILLKHPGVLEANYTCSKCGRGYQDHYSYTNHVAACNFHRTDLMCIICSNTFHASQYSLHLKTCPLENRTLVLENMASNGMVSDLLECTHHDMKFNNEDCLVLHYVHEHMGPVFPQYSGPRKELYQYLRDKAAAGNNTTLAPALKCPKCDQFVPGKLKEFKQHMVHVHGEDKVDSFVCHICDRPFSRYSSVLYHIRTVHGGIPKRRKSDRKITQVFECSECDYKAVSKCRVENHRMTVHDGVHRYECSECKFATNELGALKRHTVRHQNVLPFECPMEECKYKTVHGSDLVKHCKKVHDTTVEVQEAEDETEQVDNEDEETMEVKEEVKEEKSSQDAAGQDGAATTDTTTLVMSNILDMNGDMTITLQPLFQYT